MILALLLLPCSGVHPQVVRGANLERAWSASVWKGKGVWKEKGASHRGKRAPPWDGSVCAWWAAAPQGLRSAPPSTASEGRAAQPGECACKLCGRRAWPGAMHRRHGMMANGGGGGGGHGVARCQELSTPSRQPCAHTRPHSLAPHTMDMHACKLVCG